MRSIFTRVAVLGLLFFMSTEIAFAAVNLNKPFGGKIMNTKALEIQTLEAANFQCMVLGSSITIYPVGNYPTSYLIPLWVKSRTGTTPMSGQWILGLYSQTQTPVTCIFRGYPPATEVVMLNTITLFGTSGAGVSALNSGSSFSNTKNQGSCKQKNLLSNPSPPCSFWGSEASCSLQSQCVWN